MIHRLTLLAAVVSVAVAASSKSYVLSSAKVSVTFLLPHCKVDELEKELLAVSTPGSSRRFDYKPRSELYTMLYPCPERLEALEQWLSAEDIDPETTFWSQGKDFVSFSTTAAHVRETFGSRVTARDHPASADLALARLDIEIDETHVLSDVVLPKVRVRGVIAASERIIVSEDEHEKPILEFNVENIKALLGGAEGAVAYSLKYYPPPPFFQVVVRSGSQSEVVAISTCMKKPWANSTVPFPDGSYPDTPANPNDPCGDGAEVSSYALRLEPTSGTGKAIDIKPSQQCGMIEFAMPQYTDLSPCEIENQGVYLGICILKFDVSLPEFEPHTLSAKLSMTDGSQYDITYAASNGQALDIVNAPTLFPEEIRTRYNVPADAAVCEASTQQAVAVPQGQDSGFYSMSDLKRFYKTAGINSKNADKLKFVSTPTVSDEAKKYFASQNMLQSETTIENNQNLPGGETSLDVQYITALGLGALTTVWHGGFWTYESPTVIQGCWGFDALIEVVLLVEFAENPPSVISFSYGWPEIDTSPEEAFLNEHFMMMGAHGISVIVASGDQGARDYDFTYHGEMCDRMTPVFPGASPYVTTVGSTQRTATEGEEIACSIATGGLITTGGGFSINHAMLPFQQDAVSEYLKTADLPPAHMFNASNSGYPDIALFGHSFGVVQAGNTVDVDGTSASTPTFAGLVTLLNDALARTNGTHAKSLGFLNPALYSAAKTHPEAFVDVVKGDNKCIGQGAPLQCCDTGYVTAKGWDPVTGLGSPNLLKLADALLPSNWASAGIGDTTCAGLSGGNGPSSGLKTWEIAVIAVGGLALIGGVIFIFVSRNKGKKEESEDAYAPMLG